MPQTRKMVHVKHEQTGMSLEAAVDELQKDFESAMEAVLGAIRNAQTTYGAVSLRVGRPKPDTEPHIPRPPSPAIRAPAPPPTPPESMHEEEQGAPPGAAAREQPSLDMPLLHVPTAASSKPTQPMLSAVCTERRSTA